MFLGGPCSEKEFCLVFPFAQFVRRCTDRLDTSSLPDLYLISHCTQYIKEQNMEITVAQRFEHRNHDHFKGELNPEMKLSQSIELFVTKILPPIRSLSDV